MEKVLVIGAGQAGLQVAASLRQAGYAGGVTLVGAEPHPPYQRPPLSKAYLQGDLSIERLLLRPAEFFRKHDIALRLSSIVESVDLNRRSARLATGEAIEFDKVIFATGAPPRRLSVAGAELAGVCYLRTVDDSDNLRKAITASRRIAVIGAGYIGLEVAASARKARREVTVIEMQDRPLARVAGPSTAAYFADLHRAHGVTFRFGAEVAAVIGDGHVRAVALSTGEEIECDAVLVGIGAKPATGLAEAAGLAVADGIVVNAEAQTSHPAAWAAGDCASFPSTLYGRRIRLESAPNAIDQAKVAALSVAGAAQVYDPTPWFWSDQYDVKLQTVGLCQGADEAIIRQAGRSQSVWYLKNGVLIAVDCMNDAPAFVAGKRLVAAKARPAPSILANPDVDFRAAL